jgi:uncharacterized protein (DUF1501 family)
MKNTRRDFLKKSGCALSMSALATTLQPFGLMSAYAQKTRALAAAPPSDYRALVCIFLSGGSDGNNTVIPNHNDANVSNYSAYSAGRAAQGLALAQNALLPISVPRIGGLSYGLHPSLGPISGQPNNGIHELWGLGKMAILTNVGTLVQPLTRAQYQSGAPRPFQLFSHSDQVNQHQTAHSHAPILSGWGGRISDKITTSANPASLVPTVTTISGAPVFVNGQTTQPVAISPAPTPLSSVLALVGVDNTATSQARLAALEAGLQIGNSQEYIAAANALQRQAIDISRTLGTNNEVTVTFPNTMLGNQLKQAARMIKTRVAFNVTRQVFYCSLGGFDTHSGQLANQGALLTQVSQAMRAFYEEMVVQGLADKVTQFTLTDFSRTFNPAGSGGNVGSDHAWGNHAFVVGGSVIGGDFYGNNTSNGTPFMTLAQNGPDDSDNGAGARGRWIPTTSVEQYAATLAKWFGLEDADREYVFPNLDNFPVNNLGFMTP